MDDGLDVLTFTTGVFNAFAFLGRLNLITAMASLSMSIATFSSFGTDMVEMSCRRGKV